MERQATQVWRNAMTVDVEDYFHVQALSGAIRRDQWDEMPYRADQSTRRLLQLFADRGVKATFFVLGWVAHKDPGLVREIAAAGHEIACHGWSHRLVYDQTVDDFRSETIASKALLEDLIGHEVSGYRAASYSITGRSLWALDVLIEAGFQYDSSIFPVRHDTYGIPGSSPHPGPVSAPSGKQILEFPLSTVDLLGTRLPIAGGGYFRLLPYMFTEAGLRSVNVRQRQPFVFYLHPWEIDPGQPRINCGWLSRFRHYTNLDVCETRLARLLDKFHFTTMREVLGDALIEGRSHRVVG
jgi:polysaccharide deacetylase family protein (PEP-CTERM system associated)